MEDKHILSAKFIGIARLRLATDGEGITTLAAFHGCPLRCIYCLNPHCLSTQYRCKEYDVKQLIDEIKIDNLYFFATGGGVTFGGGEPLLNSSFIQAFCQQRPKEWKISIESSLNVPTKNVQKVAPYIKEWMIDIKDMAPEIYKSYTGRDNLQVRQNLHWISSQPEIASRVIIRLPLIPLYNTDADRDRSEKQLRTLGFTHFDRFDYVTHIKTP